MENEIYTKDEIVKLLDYVVREAFHSNGKWYKVSGKNWKGNQQSITSEGLVDHYFTMIGRPKPQIKEEPKVDIYGYDDQ